jgi:hypothetical protein
MNTNETFAISIILFQFIVFSIVLFKYVRLLSFYKEYVRDTEPYKDALVEYCLYDILSRYVEKEDYANAAKCRELNIK